jgi:hypothetical protein
VFTVAATLTIGIALLGAGFTSIVAGTLTIGISDSGCKCKFPVFLVESSHTMGTLVNRLENETDRSMNVSQPKFIVAQTEFLQSIQVCQSG